VKILTSSKALLTIIVSIFLVSSVFSASQDSTSKTITPLTPVGAWVTIDDLTDSPRSIVVITEQNGQLSGIIHKIFYRKGEGPNDVCTKCTGEQHGQKFLGMQVLANMKQVSSDTWMGGTILDPESGKTYKCKITVEPNNEKLKVRGYIGVSLFGRTQTWIRQ